MIFFLISSVISFAIFGFVLSLQRISSRDGRKYVLNHAWISVEIQETFLRIVILFLLSILLGLGFYFAMADVMRPSSSLYGLFAFVTGDVFNRMVLGFAFGGLSAVWLTRIYRKGGSVDAAPQNPGDPAVASDRLSFVEKLEGMILIVLFIIGTTPYTLQDLLGGLKVDAVGVKFELQSNSPNQSGSNAPDMSSIVLGLRENSDITSTVFAPNVLRSMAVFVDRDNSYLKLHRSRCGNDAAAETCKAAADKAIETHTQIQRDIGASLDIFGKCLLEFRSETASEAEFTDIVASLLPDIQELYVNQIQLKQDAEPSQLFEDAIRRSEAHFGKVAQDIIGHLRRLGRLPKQAVAINASSCEEVEKRLVKTPVDDIGPLPGPKKEFGDWSFPIKAAVLNSSRERPYFTILYAALLSICDQREQAIALLEEWQAQQEQLRNLPAGSYAKYAAGNVASMDFWYLLRVRVVESSLFQDWKIDRSPAPLSAASYDDYVLLLNAYRNQLETIPAIVNRNTYYPMDDEAGIEADSSSSHVSVRIPPSGKCKAETERENPQPVVALPTGHVLTGGTGQQDEAAAADAIEALRIEQPLLAAYYSALLSFTRRAIDHPDYVNELLPPVDTILDDLTRTDLSCLAAYVPGQFNFFRSEVFRIYGMAQVTQVRARRPVGGDYDDWVKTRLKTALSAFQASKSIVIDDAQQAKRQRLAGGLKTRWQLSDAEGQLDDINARIDQVSRALAAFDRK
jgi:hypothetical protein